MNFSISIEQGDKEPIVLQVVDENGDSLTGKSDIKIKIRRQSDGQYFDWTDDTFKEGHLTTTLTWALEELSSSYSPGQYQLNKSGHVNGFDTASIQNPLAIDFYIVTAIQDGGIDAINVPMLGEIRIIEPVSGGVVEDR